MKTLADRIFVVIPDTAQGLSMKAAQRATGQSSAHVRRAFEALHAANRARIVKRGCGGALYLVHPESEVTTCVVCRREFTPPVAKRSDSRGVRRSQRKTCSRKCHAALGWLAHPEKRGDRCKALSAAQSTPKAMARIAAHNKRRWAKPEEHEKLREQNRLRWKDNPEKRFEYGAKLAIINGTPEKKKFYSEMRKAHWADPVKRKKMYDAATASQRVAAYREKLSRITKERWADPVWRAKWAKKQSAHMRNSGQAKRMVAAKTAKRKARATKVPQSTFTGAPA